MEMEWTKIAAIVCISAVAAELIAFGRADLGATLVMALCGYLFGDRNGFNRGTRIGRAGP